MIAGRHSQCGVGKLAFSQRTSVELITAPRPSKPYGTREDLTTGGPANCPMRRDPFPTHVKLTMRSSRPNLSPMPTAWDNGIAARFMPKRYTSRELVKLAEEFGWMLVGVGETITTSSTRRAGS